MIRRERKFYSEEFRERVLTAYYNSNESVDMIARRFQVKRDTVSSWVHRKRVASNPKESSKFVVSSIIPMKEEKLPIEAMEERIRELSPYKVTKKVMENAGEQAIFLHCLPSFHDLKTKIGKEMGERFNLTDMEVTDEVFESAQSLVFDEAENRMHTIKAVMAATLGA